MAGSMKNDILTLHSTEQHLAAREFRSYASRGDPVLKSVVQEEVTGCGIAAVGDINRGQTTVFWAALGAGKAFMAAVGRLPDGYP